MPRGQKTCPKCQTTMGPRTHICPKCQHQFANSAAKPAELARTTAAVPAVSAVTTAAVPSRQQGQAALRLDLAGDLITTPAGACPIAWQGDLKNWVSHVMDDGKNYSPVALKYWLRQLVLQGEYPELAKQLDAMALQEVAA